MSNDSPLATRKAKIEKLFDAFWDHDAKRPKMGDDGEPLHVPVDNLYLLATGGEDWNEDPRKRQMIVGGYLTYLNKKLKPAGLRVRPSGMQDRTYVIGRL